MLFDKIKSSGIWQTLEVGVTFITQFLYLAIMARILSKQDFGLMAIANSFVIFGSLFAESGMGAALIQKKDLTNKHINAALQGGILFGLILFILFFLSAPLIANFFKVAQVGTIIKVISVTFLIVSLSAASLGILQRDFKFKEKAIVTIISTIIAYAAGVISGIYGLGVWSLIVASMLLSILKTVGYLYFARIRFLNRVHLKEWKELYSFGFGMTLVKISNYIGTSGIILVLGKVFSPTVLGVFERTFTIKTLPSKYIGNVLDTIMFPAMAQIQTEEDRLFTLYQYSLGIVNTILMPISIYLIFFCKEIVLILLGKEWSEAVVPLQIMFIVLAFSSSGRMADSVIRATGMIYKNVYRKYLYVIVLIISATFGGYKFGLAGAAAGVTFSYLFNYILMLFLVKNIFKKSIGEIFLSPILSGLKLTLILLFILLAITTILNLWGTTSVTYFMALTFLLALVVLLIIWRKPSFFGVYVGGLLNRMNSFPK
ncbi:MAG TPA: lipopolysaccharide biosynthesis protein [Bacteroidales bacterium]|nr:lipopolysaccharide biosynthesis protein [Bacteroidales bacterium]